MPAELLQRLTCTRSELVALVGLLGGKAVIGIDDPLRGLSSSAVDAAFLSAREGLERRRFLRLAADGFLEISPDVARLAAVVAKPTRSYYADLTKGSALDSIEHGTRRVFHVRDGVAVELSDGLSEATVCALAAGRSAIADAVVGFWEVRDQAAAGSERARLSQAALHEAARIGADQGRAAAFEKLRSAGVPPVAADTLAGSLAAARANAALIAFSMDAPPNQTRTIGMLDGGRGLWRLRVPAPDQVELEPASGQALARLVHDFVMNA